MVRLVYHTAALGPICLDYTHPVITVGSALDNDLVLPHPSVRPQHCQIELRDRSLVLWPAGTSVAAAQAGGDQNGREYQIGEKLTIGELVFEVDYSSQTVAIPDARPAESPAPALYGPLYFCPQCDKYYPLSALTRIGLEKRRKHLLCPKCSREVIAPPGPGGPRGLSVWVKRRLRKVARFLRRRGR
jgi:hypothetical protein